MSEKNKRPGPDYTVPPDGYEITEDNRILRYGKMVAIYDPETQLLNYPNPMDAKYGTSVAWAMRSAGKVVRKKSHRDMNLGRVNAEKEAQAMPSVAPVTYAPPPDEEPAPYAPTVTTNTAEAHTPLPPPDPEPVTEPEAVPPMPPKNPDLGRKTPEIVEWYQKYHPEEFKRIYKGRKTHLGWVNEDGSVTPVTRRRRQVGGIPVGSM